jgi:hypothetical protein
MVNQDNEAVPNNTITEQPNDNQSHSLEILNNAIYLDGFRIKGMISYQLNSISSNSAELNLKLLIDQCKDNIRCNIG